MWYGMASCHVGVFFNRGKFGLCEFCFRQNNLSTRTCGFAFFFSLLTSPSVLSKLIFCNTLAHRTRAAHTTADHPQQLVDIVGSAPLLVRDDLDT